MSDNQNMKAEISEDLNLHLRDAIFEAFRNRNKIIEDFCKAYVATHYEPYEWETVVKHLTENGILRIEDKFKDGSIITEATIGVRPFLCRECLKNIEEEPIEEKEE